MGDNDVVVAIFALFNITIMFCTFVAFRRDDISENQ